MLEEEVLPGLLLSQDGQEADGGVPSQGVLQAAIDGPHPQDEAPRGIDPNQQQRLSPHSTGLLGQEKEEQFPGLGRGGDTQVCCASPTSIPALKTLQALPTMEPQVLGLTCGAGSEGLCDRSRIFSPKLRSPFRRPHTSRHSGQQGRTQPGTRWVLKQRGQKSWPQSSEMGSRGRSRQMEQAGSSRGAEAREPRPSFNLGNGGRDLGAAGQGQGALKLGAFAHTSLAHTQNLRTRLR